MSKPRKPHIFKAHGAWWRFSTPMNKRSVFGFGVSPRAAWHRWVINPEPV